MTFQKLSKLHSRNSTLTYFSQFCGSVLVMFTVRLWKNWNWWIKKKGYAAKLKEINSWIKPRSLPQTKENLFWTELRTVQILQPVTSSGGNISKQFWIPFSWFISQVSSFQGIIRFIAADISSCSYCITTFWFLSPGHYERFFPPYPSVNRLTNTEYIFFKPWTILKELVLFWKLIGLQS